MIIHLIAGCFLPNFSNGPLDLNRDLFLLLQRCVAQDKKRSGGGGEGGENGEEGGLGTVPD